MCEFTSSLANIYLLAIAADEYQIEENQISKIIRIFLV